MPNIHDSNTFNRVGHSRPLPATFNVDFINHINHGLYDDQLEPVGWFAELHQRFDAEIGRDEVSRHIVEAIRGGEFESDYPAKD